MRDQKFCQSCSMPLKDAADFGTDAGGAASGDYCKYCYQDGAFTTEGSMEEMIESCVPFMAQGNPGMTEQQARERMMAFFPMLKRWKKD